MNLVQTTWGRRLLFYLLYISEGAPIGFIWWALPTEMSTLGVDTVKIAELAAIAVLPWTLKLFWSPIVDMLQFRKWNLRHWIFTCQFAMAMTLLPLASLNWLTDFDTVRLLLIAHAIFAATQDVAIDAWAIRSTSADEHGRINGFMQMGMLSGRWLFASGYLLLSAAFPQNVLVYCLVGVILLTSLVVILNPDPQLEVLQKQSPKERFVAFHNRLFRVLTQRVTWLGLFYAATAGLGYNAGIAVLGDYFLKRGLTENQVAHFFSYNILALLLGSFAGGLLADRYGRRALSGLMVLVMSLTVLIISYLDHVPGSSNDTLYWIFQGLHLEMGIFVAATYGLLMDVTDKELGATQYSAFMGAINLCESWAAFGFAGIYAKTSSYGSAFGTFALVSLIGLIALPFLKKSVAGESILLRRLRPT